MQCNVWTTFNALRSNKHSNQTVNKHTISRLERWMIMQQQQEASNKKQNSTNIMASSSKQIKGIHVGFLLDTLMQWLVAGAAKKSQRNSFVCRALQGRHHKELAAAYKSKEKRVSRVFKGGGSLDFLIALSRKGGV